MSPAREGQRDPLLVATRNVGKLRELRALFARAGVPLLDLDGAAIPLDPSAEDALEVSPTFEGNALAKARYFSRLAGGRAVVADDSGLEVRVLGGAPGVRSRRYSGVVGPAPLVDEANVAQLLHALRGARDRRARFVCAAAYVGAQGECVCLGEVAGWISEAPRGDGGFGYDPVFVSDELGKAFGEVSPAEKAAVSHRTRAFEALAHSIWGR